MIILLENQFEQTRVKSSDHLKCKLNVKAKRIYKIHIMHIKRQFTDYSSTKNPMKLNMIEK